MKAPLIALLVAASTVVAAPAYAAGSSQASTTDSPVTGTTGWPAPGTPAFGTTWAAAGTPLSTTPDPTLTPDPAVAPNPAFTASPMPMPGMTGTPVWSPAPTPTTAQDPASLASALALASPGTTVTGPNGSNGPSGLSGLSDQDQSFIAAASEGTQFEVLAGQIAQQRAGDQRIRTFAAQLVTDHGAALTQLSQLAQSVGATVPAQPSPAQLTSQQRAILDMWSQLSGAGFDCSFASSEYLDHEMVVAVFQDEANHGDNPRLHLFAVTQLPALQSHLNSAGANLDGLSCGAATAAPSTIPTPMPTVTVIAP